ncbi:hypothetical protein D9N16_05890 [Lactococcus raffinolactis]|uniref:phage distal tail protein domain-containing protein n=1 Tax=Pseudolactococcus raffinolactis TaxID=1366 RepID=UPI001C70A079|nr:phage distal tail protein domain-containing protein [Lactococcus raffinolactis]MBW9298299.1 hypothetical protein [Lactococcus raffinolactis]
MIQKVRQLKLYNSRNDLVDLVNERWIFGTNPDDMGAKFGNDIFQVGANTLISKRQLESSSLKLDMYYGLEETTEYESFNRFVEFLNYTPYRLSYENDAIGEVFRDCVIAEITRPDISEDGMLIGNLTLDFLTPFYREISETYKPTSDTEGDGKIYAGANNQMNLIVDPNFEDRSTLHWLYTGDEPGGSVRLPPKSDKPNSNIVQLISSGNREAGLMNSWGMTVKEGNRLSFRVDIRTEGNPDFTRPVIRLGGVANNRTYSYSDFGIISNSNDFKTAMISFVVDHDGDFTITLLNKNMSTLSEMSTYFREPMLIRGDIADMPPDFYPGKPSNNYYVYPYVYESDYNGKSGVFQIENNSVYIGSAKGSPVEITVHGPCANPYWEILDGSKVLQSDGYNIDVPDGYKLVVSSVVQKQRVKLIAPDGTISDVYQQQDLSKSNFATIPEGHVTLAFHNVGDVSFNYREEYITV